MDERSPEANAAKQEAAKLAAQKARDAAKPKPTPVTAGGGVPSQSGQVDRYRQMARERARKNSMGMESTDLFDIVKGHLMSEGLSEEDALKKMLKMTEEEKAEIVEMNAGPSTPVKEYDGKIMPNYGGGRIGKVRPKKGQV
jgi:hypothetical protein